MTKTEIHEMIEGSMKAQKDAVGVVNEMLKAVSINADTAVLASILHTMTGCICDTMNNLALILCEMLPEPTPEKAPEPKRGTHSATCMRIPSTGCQCLTCANDHGHTLNELSCCMEHRKHCLKTCPDYVKEE